MTTHCVYSFSYAKHQNIKHVVFYWYSSLLVHAFVFYTFVVVNKDLLVSISVLIIVFVSDFNGQSAGPTHVVAPSSCVSHNDR